MIRFGAGVAVFAWPHEEVETDPDNVGNALRFCVAADVLGDDVVQDSCWEWFDALRWRVLLNVAA